MSEPKTHNVDEMEIQGMHWRKLPLVIQAVQLPYPFEVTTREGVMTGKANDYLCIGIAGERYPMDREIFEKSYVASNPEADRLQAIFDQIAEERVRQDARWGGPRHDDLLSLHDFSSFIMKKIFQMWGEQYQGIKASFRFIQIAALAVAAIQSAYRREARMKEMEVA
jgi:hypothetical protein